jgi:hypothetical protein
MKLEPTIAENPTISLDFYLANYPEVWIVACDECDNDIAIEVRGDVAGYPQNELGMVVLPTDEKLLGSRVRLDVDDLGTPNMGYRCACGNQTILSDREDAFSPERCKAMRVFDPLPHELAEMVPNIRSESVDATKETFTRRRVK